MSNFLPDIQTTLIVGTGLLGGSLALAMKQAGHTGRILGLNRSPETNEKALALGLVDAIADGPQAAAEADLVVVGVPLSGFGKVFENLAPHLKPSAIVTDLGSTKVSVQRDAETHLPSPSRFVGSHPMAGSEKQGPEAADGKLFVGKPCIVCASEACDADALSTVQTLWSGLGMSLLTMGPKDHDRHVAHTSHLPHALSVLLASTVAETTGFATASTGLQGATRLAASNPPMRLDIITHNQQPLLDAIDAFSSRLAAMRNALAEGDRDQLLAMLNDAQNSRADWLFERGCSTGDEEGQPSDPSKPCR